MQDLINEDLDVTLSYFEGVFDPCFKSSSQELKPVYREITNDEIAIDSEEAINKEVELWTKDFATCLISHKEIYT